MDRKNESCPLLGVRRSTLEVLKKAKHVKIEEDNLLNELKNNLELYSEKNLPPDWKGEYHFFDGSDDSVQYILVLDALNFCFWPQNKFEYFDLASGLKLAFEAKRDILSAENLIKLTPEVLKSWFSLHLPFAEERVRLLREVGSSLKENFDGKASNLVRSAKNSASKLVQLVTAHFPGFRDHAIYKGEQVFFYKRAQIFVADLWGAFGGKGLGHFEDIADLTCFADYRIPQLLQSLSIIKYSSDLEKIVLEMGEIEAGSTFEIEIRAATVQCIEKFKKELMKKGKHLNSIQLDWIFWERGEAQLEKLPPHHRVKTIFY